MLIEQRKKAGLDYLSGIEIAERIAIKKGIENKVASSTVETVMKMREKKFSLDIICDLM